MGMETDGERAAFLDDLDNAEFSVTSWESEFIESNLDRETFTAGQRKVIDDMMDKCDGRL